MGTLMAVHTSDGAPINESALCTKHYSGGQLYDHAVHAATIAMDRPGEIVFTEVRNPNDNDTVCIECSMEEN